MYRFKEQYRDAKICIPSLRLEITSENVNQWAELIYKEFPTHKEMIELIEDKKEVKKVAKTEEVNPVSSPPLKSEE